MKQPYQKPEGAPEGPICWFSDHYLGAVCPHRQPHPKTGDMSCAAFGNTRLHFVYKCPACAIAHGEVPQ